VIHSHLAEEPQKVYEINPVIPEQLSDIIVKLLLKQPEKRYQSAAGLLADLLRCRDDYAALGMINKFQSVCVIGPKGVFLFPNGRTLCGI